MAARLLSSVTEKGQVQRKMSEIVEPEVGLKGEYLMTVETRHLAPAEEYDPRVSVLSTPYVVWLMERAVTDAIRDHDNPEVVSLGINVEFEHIAPTPKGHQVIAQALLAQIEGHRLTFEVEVHDEMEVVARGKLWRYQLPVDTFQTKLKSKTL